MEMFKCPDCRKKYIREQKLIEHRIKVHDCPAEPPTQESIEEGKKPSKDEVEKLREQVILLKTENLVHKSTVEHMRAELLRPIIVMSQPH